MTYRIYGKILLLRNMLYYIPQQQDLETPWQRQQIQQLQPILIKDIQSLETKENQESRQYQHVTTTTTTGINPLHMTWWFFSNAKSIGHNESTTKACMNIHFLCARNFKHSKLNLDITTNISLLQRQNFMDSEIQHRLVFRYKMRENDFWDTQEY